MINSKEQLVKYIRLQLGEPIVRLELTDEHIRTIIDETIGLYTDVVYGDFEDNVLLPAIQATSNVYIPAFKNVLQVLAGYGSQWIPYGQVIGGIPAIGSAYYVAPPGRNDVQYRWNNIKRTLVITDAIVPESMIVVGLTSYHANDEADHIFNETWVKAMAKAKTQRLWGQVLGKYTQNLVGSAQINFDRIIQEADTEIEKLMEELQDKWVDPAPVLVG